MSREDVGGDVVMDDPQEEIKRLRRNLSVAQGIAMKVVNKARPTSKKIQHTNQYYNAKQALEDARKDERDMRKQTSERRFVDALAQFNDSAIGSQILSDYKRKHGGSGPPNKNVWRGLMLREKLLVSGKSGGGGGGARKAQNQRYRSQAASILGIGTDRVTKAVSSWMHNDPRASEKLSNFRRMNDIFRSGKSGIIKRFTKRQLAKAQQL